MSSKHLGRQLHDFIDGRLSPAESTLAMEHLDHCIMCAHDVDELRAARKALQSSDTGIPRVFVDQLRDPRYMEAMAQIHDERRARTSSRLRRVAPAVVVASVVVMSGAMGAAWVAGAPEALDYDFAGAVPSGTQSVMFVNAQSIRDAEELDEWVHPDWDETDLIPVDATVFQGANGQRLLIATLVADLDTVVLTQTRGQLNPQVSDLLHSANVDGLNVFVTSTTSPAQVVWQSGEMVVALTCECAMATLEAVAAQFPTGQAPGPLERLSTGFRELVGAVS